MKLTSTNRPFGLTIKFTWHTWRTCQRGDLDGDPGLEFLMLFSCERSPAWAGRQSGALASRYARLERARLQPCRQATHQIGALAPDKTAKFFHRFGATGPAWNHAWDRVAGNFPHAPAKPVILPRGKHPFPSRTRQLSPAGSIVLHAKVCGRVGRRRHK